MKKRAVATLARIWPLSAGKQACFIIAYFFTKTIDGLWQNFSMTNREVLAQSVEQLTFNQ